MRYLLDTDTCIYLIKKQSPEIIEHFKSHKISAVAVSIISYFELEYGVRNSDSVRQNKAALNKFIDSIHLIGMDRLAADSSALIRAELKKKGTSIGPYDTFIAGIALSQNLILVSNNIREFERVEGLKIENWLE
ncbi:MAG TPA: type II toxin-antitoxin system VapC family toxin [Candidatus Lambdaproteobacteria bacterium]|nr:type II toxin-antitoxin system VapC family toxin [SAR324 cluster bacterium]HBL56388.1 VapC toxin family PIN domain ribonuclease [Deltaproteobacteria bacterium]HIB45609.1 type II toxin-antitoxin system VapC family toxin [Candidatus Lambdaproteobacteria bacterium]HIN47574.1 type II toxin-antitoxin system VapC family toxin [Deltaproteobacteria bacterium]